MKGWGCEDVLGGGRRGGGVGCQREGKDGGSSLYEPREGYQMMRVAARELEGALREREERREPVSGVEFVRVQGVQGLRGAGILQGVRAMAARVYAGEEWYVQDDGGTGRIECLYERAKRGVGAVKFVVARLTTEDRWASDGRRAARTDVVQGGQTMGGEGGTATERSAADGAGGSVEADDGGEGAGSDNRATGPQGCRVAGMGSGEVGCATGGVCDGGESGGEGGGGEGSDGRVGAGGGVRGGGGGRRGGRGEGGRGCGPSGGEGAEEGGGAAAAGEGEGVVGGEERIGRGEKRGRGEREADSEGRQVRMRTDRRGGRKRKKGDG